MTYWSLRMSASHIVLYLKEVSWNPLASLPVKLDWNNMSTQWNRSASTEMMFPSGSSLKQFGLCVVIKTNAVRLLKTSGTISHSVAAADKEY